MKHENHTPIGTFKVRGGIVYFDRLKRDRPQDQGIITATRGNHGQSASDTQGFLTRIVEQPRAASALKPVLATEDRPRGSSVMIRTAKNPSIAMRSA